MGAAVGGCVGGCDGVGSGVALCGWGKGGGAVVLGEEVVVEDDVEFAGTGGDGGAGFAQLGVGVLRALVEADDAGDDYRGAFEVGDAAGNPVQADAYALVDVRMQCK